MFTRHFPNSHTVSIHDSSAEGKLLPFKVGDKVPEGHGVFFTPNGCVGRRLKENLSHVTSVFADFDFKSGVPELKQFLLDIDELPTATYIVRSKNGYHCYWRLTEPIVVTDKNRDELIKTMEAIHRQMVVTYGADAKAADILHLLRIPDYEHRKDINNPFMVEIVSDDSDTTYTLEELTHAIPPLYEDAKPAYEPSPSDFDLRKVVVDVWKEKGSEASFNKMGQLIIDGVRTATFLGRKGSGGYIATTSTDYPYQGNATTYVAGVLGTSTSEAYKWLGYKYGFPEKEFPDKEVTVVPTVEEINWDDLMFTESEQHGKQYLSNDENIIRIFNHYKSAKYDSFNARPYLCINGEWLVRDMGSDGKMFSWLVDKFPFLAKVTIDRVANLLTFVQYRNTYDSAQDYVNSLTWDGVSRLDTWLPSVFYVEKDSYYRDIGSKWFMGMVSRIMHPGCKFDNALVVHGGQNIGKSSVFLIIAGEDNHIEFTDLRVKEMSQDMQGKLIVEFAEAAIFSKADSESLKSIVSRQTDTFRVPYERHARDFPRRCVFAVTANNDDILKDSTGGRRWWAVDVPDDMKVYPPKRQADIHWLRDNRDQLFAEAAARVANGEDFRKIDEYELLQHQKSITATEQDEDLFINWYHCLSAGVQNAGMAVRDAYCGAYKNDYRGEPLDVNHTPIKKADEMRVGRILKKLGLEKRHTRAGSLWFPGERFDRNFEIKFKKTVHEYKDF